MRKAVAGAVAPSSRAGAPRASRHKQEKSSVRPNGADERTRAQDGLHHLRRERILAEAAELFNERGYSGTTVDAIAEQIGVTKPFIYYYIEKKSDILAEICDQTIELPLIELDRALADRGGPKEILQRFVLNFTRVQIENQKFVNVFFREELQLEPAMRNRMNAKRRQFDNKLSQLLETGMIKGEFDISDPRLSALALGGMVCWAFTWYRPSGRLSLDQICDYIAGCALNLVRARP